MGTTNGSSTGSDSGPMFGDVLRQLRREAGLTQEELAAHANLSPRGLSDLERGVNRYPRRETVLALAKALQVTDEIRAQLFAAARRRRIIPAVHSTGLTAASNSSDAAPVGASVRGPQDTPGAPGSIPDVLSADQPEPNATSQAPHLGQGPVQIFLIADVRGSTRYTVEHGDEVWARLAMRFAELADQAVAARGGRVLELRGDEAMAVFASVRAALHAAVEMQERFTQEMQADPTLQLHSGIGLDAGEAVPVAGGYRGLALNMAARLCSMAGPGEVLASETIINLAHKVDGIGYIDRGPALLKGFAEPMRVIQVVRSNTRAVDPTEPSAQAQAGTSAQSIGQATDLRMREPDRPVGGFLGAEPEHPLVARDREIETLLTALKAVQGGVGRMMLLVGEPGVGKTRLAQEVTQAARSRGFFIATGRCYAPQERVPYYPFLEALSRAYAAVPRALQAALLQQWPEVARLMPDLSLRIQAVSAGPASGGYDDQQRLFWHVTGFLQAMASERPVALMLDDLHWADGASLDLLAHLVRHTHSDRILTLGTYRDADVQPLHPLSKVLRDLSREHLVERIAVHVFPKEGTAALLAAMLGGNEVSDTVATLVHGPTEGNAFFAQEVLRVLVERGDMACIDERWELREGVELAVPENVRITILERVSRLSLAAQDLLPVASVLGQTFTFDDLLSTHSLAMHVSQSQPTSETSYATELEAILEEAIGASVLREEGADGYTFNHALTQRALYEQLTGRRRRRLHRAAAETIERLPKALQMRRVAEVAYHFLQAEEPAQAQPYALQAGVQAESVYANAEAASHYTMAIDLARRIGDRSFEGAALERLGLLHWWNTGDYGVTMEIQEQAVEVYRSSGDREGWARTAAQLARTYARCGKPGAGLALLAPLLKQLHDELHEDARESRAPALQATVLTALADTYLHSGAYPAQLAASGEAVEIWRALGDVRSLADAMNLYGIALRLLGRWEDALRELEGVATLVDQAEGTVPLFIGAHALYHIAISYLQSGQLPMAGQAITQGVEWGEQSGNVSFYGSARFMRGFVAFRTGNWAAARLWFDRAASVLNGKHLYTVRAYGPLGQGLIDVATGEMEAGLDSLGVALTIAQQSGFIFILYRVQREIGEVELVMGHAQEARERLEPLVHDESQQNCNDTTPLMALLAWAYVELGELELADALLERAAAQAEHQHHQLALLDILRAHGLLLAKQARYSEAQSALEEALALARSMPDPYAEAKVLYVYGQLHAAWGAPRAACEKCQAALTICEQLGERLYRGYIERALAEAVALAAEGGPKPPEFGV